VSDRSCGGRTTKIYAIVDGTCRPLAFYLSPDNVADITAVLSVLANTLLSRQFFDQVHDASALRQRLVERERPTCDVHIRRSAPIQRLKSMRTLCFWEYP
jgi:hypothetical protein